MRETASVNGIILSSMPVGEADRRLSLLTKEFGKISCFARGARRPTSRLVGETRPFVFGMFELLPGKDAYTLESVDVREYFEPILSDLTRTAYGSCFLELAGRMSHENADGGPMLALLYYALKALVRGKPEPSLVKIVFEAKTLQIEGVMPSFTQCAKCGKALEQAEFLPALMQPVCTDCGPSESLYPLSKSALYALNYTEKTEPGKLFAFSVTPEVEKELKDAVGVLLRHEMNKPLAAESMLELLVGAEKGS
ncbi:MAG: DNA repair protein RecO [Lachnospiraceae bacterium]|nr:DNA repair protein RecO [Lachnospiraceae bacterium]